MDEPTVTAVIPAFDAEAHIARAIESALSQTRAPDEVIVVDDGSCDGTKRIAASYPEPVRLIRHETNRGLAAARNTGIEAATGDLVALLDSDDVWFAEKLERQLAALNPSGAEPGVAATGSRTAVAKPGGADAVPGVVFCLTRIVRSDGVAFIDCADVPSPQDDPAGFRHAMLHRNAVSGSGCSPLIRRDVLLAAGGYDESLGTCEDWDLWLRLARRTGFHRVDEVLCQGHVRAEGLNLKLDRLRTDALTVLRRHLPDLVPTQELAGRIEDSALALIDRYVRSLDRHGRAT